jgi:hypothetical protein
MSGTIRTRWRGLRRFVNWLIAEDIIRKDPLAGIVVDNCPNLHRYPYSPTTS